MDVNCAALYYGRAAKSGLKYTHVIAIRCHGCLCLFTGGGQSASGGYGTGNMGGYGGGGGGGGGGGRRY